MPPTRSRRFPPPSRRAPGSPQGSARRPARGLIVPLAALALAAAAGAWASEPTETVVDQGVQREVTLTVYNADLGLVTDLRGIRLGAGLTRLRLLDVPAGLDPTSVALRPRRDRDAVTVLEQRYEPGRLTPERLLEAYVGRMLELRVEGRLVPARLLGVSGGAVYEIDGKVYLSPPGPAVLPAVPETLSARPALVWLVRSREAGEKRLEIAYLTTGLSWQAAYTVRLDEGDRLADVSTWVTIANTSGASYRNAAIRLVAGDVARAAGPADRPPVLRAANAPPSAREDAAPFRRERFSEYHLYTLEGRTSLGDGETRQVRLLEARRVGVTRRLVYSGHTDRWWGPMRAPVASEKVDVIVEIENTAAAGLGQPLPAGIVRVLKADRAGQVALAGEGAIGHIPVGETVRLAIGKAFDVVGSRRQLDWRTVDDRTHEVEWEIVIRNRKGTAEAVRVVETVPGDFRLLGSSHRAEHVDAHTLRFELSAPAGGETRLTYRVRFRS